MKKWIGNMQLLNNLPLSASLTRSYNVIIAHYSVYRILYLRIIIAILLSGTFAPAGCSKNVATGERQFNIYSESQEIEMGKQADQEIVASMGLYPDQALQDYIQTLGKHLSASSERPNLPWTFRVIDDPVVNAFALPGGFIYVTRGILSHLSNEAELAGVIGHEIGHVTAKHSVNRLSTQQIAQVGLGVALILKPEWQKYGQLAGAGLGLLFLKFSRDDEKQADDLGLRYMTRINKDPGQLGLVMEMLSQVSKQSSGGKGGVPEWLSTHPDPENRKERIQEAVQKMGINTAQMSVNREEYLNRINNMVYGQDPREGYFRGNVFYQPAMKFQFTFPQGWQTVNQKQAVIGVSQNQDAIIQISLSDKPSTDQAAGSFLTQQGISSTGVQTVNINGLPATTGNFAVQTEQGPLQGNATFISYGGSVYQVLSYSTQQGWGGYQSLALSAVQSFSALNDPQLLNVEPQKIKIVKLDRDMTLDEFARTYPSTVPVETLALINQVDKGATLKAGQSVKQVTGKAP